MFVKQDLLHKRNHLEFFVHAPFAMYKNYPVNGRNFEAHFVVIAKSMRC